MTDKERREVARRLRGIDAERLDRVYGMDGEGGECSDPDMAKAGRNPMLGAIAEAVGLHHAPYYFDAAPLRDRLADLIEPQPITGDTSDGYHTFDELYDHRARLFSVIVRNYRDRAWKSRLHHDGTMYEGMFIVGVETPQGQATYHYYIDPYWDMFDCKELARAPEWDGHTPEQAISRIASLRPSCDREALLALAKVLGGMGDRYNEHERYELGTTFKAIARRIREACGEVDG